MLIKEIMKTKVNKSQIMNSPSLRIW